MAKKLVIFHSRNWSVEQFECKWYEDGSHFHHHVSKRSEKINADLLRVYGGTEAHCSIYQGESADALQKAYTAIRCTGWVEDVQELYGNACKELQRIGNNLDINSSAGRALVAKLHYRDAEMVKELRNFATLFRPTWNAICKHHEKEGV